MRSCTCLYSWEYRAMDDVTPLANSEADSVQIDLSQEQKQDALEELRQFLLEPEQQELKRIENRLERWRPDLR